MNNGEGVKMKTKTKAYIGAGVAAFFALSIIGGITAEEEGDVVAAEPVVTEAPATTTEAPTTTLPETTTTEASATTTTEAVEVQGTIDDVIALTRAESETYSTLTWVDVSDDSLLEMMAEAICVVYAEDGDKDKAILLSASAYFEGYDDFDDNDLELFGYFAGGVIDILCEV